MDCIKKVDKSTVVTHWFVVYDFETKGLSFSHIFSGVFLQSEVTIFGQEGGVREEEEAVLTEKPKIQCLPMQQPVCTWLLFCSLCL